MQDWLIYTLIAATFFGLGAAMQKHGMATEFPKIGLREFLKNWRNIIKTLFANKLWLAGFAAGPIGGAFLFQAMSDGEISVIQPLMNVGMLVTVFTGVLALKERLKPREWFAVTILLGGAVLLSVVSGEESTSAILYRNLWFLIAATILLGGLLVAAMAVGKGRLSVEFVMAALAGFGFGLGVITIKVLTEKAGAHFGEFDVLKGEQWAWMIRTAYFWVMLVVEVLGFLFFQAALSHGRVALVSPITTIASVLVPVAAGYFVFGESIGALKGIGIVVVIVGTTMLAGREEKSASPQPTE